MFNSICTFPLTSDLLAQAIHPTSSLLALGLASGYVQLQRLPALPPNLSPGCKARSPSTNGHGTVETIWRTRRHKGSCRSLAFSVDGDHLFSAGTDGIVKVATTETGEVTGKIAVPIESNGSPDAPTLLHVLSPQTLLLATDSSALHIYDLRADGIFKSAKPQQTHHPHDDYISSLTPLAPSESSTSGFSRQWFSTGGSTIAVTDIRKGIVFQSDVLGEEVLCGTVIGEKCIGGGEKGALRVWEGGVKGLIEGIEKKATLQKGESLDVMCPIPEGMQSEDMVAVGLGDGSVRFAEVGGKSGNSLDGLKHDEVEGVVSLGFEPGGRMISGGGSIVKIWERETVDDLDDEVEIDEVHYSNADGPDLMESDKSQDESSDEERRPKRKKRKRKKGKDRGGSNHIMAFKGMD
ncbi:MAG: hypothetical protein Q9166_003806 [cf. Caloplaca sp. 2 TL-2023]